MTRVRGPSLDELDRLGDRYALAVTREVRALLREYAGRLDDTPDVSDLAGMGERWNVAVRERLLPRLETVWRDEADDVRDQVVHIVLDRRARVAAAGDPTDIPAVRDELAESYLARAWNRLVNVGTMVWEVARGELLAGLRAGEGIATLRDRLVTSARLSRPRAEVIARTEVIGAANAGSLEGMRAAGLPTDKIWVATTGPNVSEYSRSRTRPSHREADGQRVPLGDKFLVGGWPMDRPHDPAAPPEETINCRCTLEYEIADDAVDELAGPEPEPVTASVLHRSKGVSDVKRLAVIASAEVRTGAMIALIPTEEDLDRLALDTDDAEPRDQLHLTLYYLGTASDHPRETYDQLVNAVASMVERRGQGPVPARVFGANHWNPDGDEPAWVLSVGDVPEDQRADDWEGLGYVRGMVREAWEDGMVALDLPTQHTPWVPHICLTYSSDAGLLETMESRVGDVTFDRIRVAFAGEAVDVSLVEGSGTLTATAKGDEMPWEIVEDSADCGESEPYAVVKKGSSEVEGCHPTREEAEEQLRALYAQEGDHESEDFGGDPNPGTDRDKRLRENKKRKKTYAGVHVAADGTETPVESLEDDDSTTEVQLEGAERGYWEGVLVVEGTPTGDGREFSPGALSWSLPGAFRWQKEGHHGGDHDVTVRVGCITEVWREDNKIMGRGFFDLGGADDDDAHEAFRRMGAGVLNGISIDADDITNADVEYVWPEKPEEEKGEDEDGSEVLMMLFGQPEKVVFHAGRIRGATLCDIPAFVEASVALVEDVDHTREETVAAGAVAPHETATSDAPWDTETHGGQLPERLDADVAHEAYAWIERGSIHDGQVTRESCRFLHHEVEVVDGETRVGPANLTAASAVIGRLHSASSADVPNVDRRLVYDHVARHLRDAGQEPEPFIEDLCGVEALVAHALGVEWRPPRSWFSDPRLGQLTPVVVTDEGRVYGHACQWGECHLGFQGECVRVPREDDGFPRFLTGEVCCDDGSRVVVGQITAGMGHAPLYLGVGPAAEHYDNTNAVVADVATGNDRHGIWVAGAIRPSADPARVHALRASGQVSPDWRYVGGQLRMVALLTVNTSGYQTPRPRARVASGQVQALVAAGVPRLGRGITEEDLDRRALQLMQRRLRSRVHPASREELADQQTALVERVHGGG